MLKKKSGFILLVLLFGSIIGAAMGQLIAFIVPEGVVKQFFLRSITVGFDPVTLNLGFLSFTIGFDFVLNIIGIIGFAFAAYSLKWYYGNRL